MGNPIVFTVLLILGLAFLAIGLYLIHRALKKKGISPLQASHRKKEEGLLKELLCDITKNRNDWFLVHDHYDAGSTFLINDRKCIGLLYRKVDLVQVHLNLKTMTKFTQDDPDTVVLGMSGLHVQKFLTTAERIIDKRGNELEFFKDKLHRQL